MSVLRKRRVGNETRVSNEKDIAGQMSLSIVSYCKKHRNFCRVVYYLLKTENHLSISWFYRSPFILKETNFIHH
jgi:predicted cupin superfamily sugar epimerase